MDRVIVYTGPLPQDTDILNTNLFAMIGQAFLNAAVIGTPTAVSGLAIAPTAPASLAVTIGVGSIYELDEIDASAYGSLGVNTTNIVKQGILSTAQSLTISPPATSGFSQVYLVQAALQDADSGNTVLSYFNSENPDEPFSGPNNSGSGQMTIRQCKCVISLKAGVPATTGTQVAPAPDAGFIGLYTVTVANGAAQITTDNIAQLASAPFFPTLPQVPYQVQQGTYVYAGQDSGAANAYVITFQPGQPIPAAYTAGMKVSFKALNACTGASTINVNGLGAVTIKRASGVSLSANDIVSGGVVELTYDGTVFQMANYLGSGATSNTNTVVGIPYVADTGAVNALVATFSPAITSAEQVAGLTVEVKLANTITGACTINVNGLGLKNVVTGDLANPPNGLFVAGEVLLLIYDGTQYQIANSTSQVYRKPATNVTIYVNGSTGSDTAYDGTSSTVAGGSSTAGPFKTISRAMIAAYGYAPSQFAITIQVAAGTYNESVTTPLYSGPNVVINGASAASVTVQSTGNTFTAQGPNTLTVQNVTAGTSGSVNNFLFGAINGATLTCNNTASNSILGSVFVGLNGGTCLPGNHTFNGGAASFFTASHGGSLNILTATFTFSSSVSVQATAESTSNGVIAVTIVNPPTFVNPSFVNGFKFIATTNGIIDTDGQGINLFPGSVPGTASSGGQYI